MVSLIVILFMELFQPGDINFRQYFTKVWRILVYSFEGVAYAGVVILPFIIYNADEKLDSSMKLVAAILLAIGFLYLRFRTTFYETLKSKKEKSTRPPKITKSSDLRKRSNWK
ncbi:hypothetical protein SAMN05444392_103140 [Seinonella peptonophila]|uniref:Uncharacterized protein n=2 Tax=Seinonella peptonophila TaxID=112248 RepID=A0A1M4WBS5_9BACL|nr:hypothetical protein SAMN05444392_103140 [Seinonella peptonophila]